MEASSEELGRWVGIRSLKVPSWLPAQSVRSSRLAVSRSSGLNRLSAFLGGHVGQGHTLWRGLHSRLDH